MSTPIRPHASPRKRRPVVLIAASAALVAWAVVGGILLGRSSGTSTPATAAAPREKPTGSPLRLIYANRAPAPAPDDTAELQIKKLAIGMRTHAMKLDEYVVSDVGLVPAEPCCKRPLRLCEPDPSRWAGEPWATLGFEMKHSTPYQYGYSGTRNRFTLVATADTNCDGRAITYVAEGSIDDNGGPRVEYFTSGED